MDRHSINDFIGGWVVGDFTPSLFTSKEVEVALKSYSAGDVEPCHFQKTAYEATLVAVGQISMGSVKFSKGEIVVIPPNECSPFRADTDAVLVCIKWPSCPEDKVICRLHN